LYPEILSTAAEIVVRAVELLISNLFDVIAAIAAFEAVVANPARLASLAAAPVPAVAASAVAPAAVAVAIFAARPLAARPALAPAVTLLAARKAADSKLKEDELTL
jgi:hypothetical protein